MEESYENSASGVRLREYGVVACNQLYKTVVLRVEGIEFPPFRIAFVKLTSSLVSGTRALLKWSQRRQVCADCYELF